MAFLGRKKDPQKELESSLRVGDHTRAAQWYEAILLADPKNQQTRLRYADCLVQASRKKDAVNEYVRVARDMAQSGFLIKAIAVYKKIVKLDPTKEEYSRELAEMNKAREEGREYVAAGERAAAEAKPEEAAAAAPPAEAPAEAPTSIPLSDDAAAVELEETQHGKEAEAKAAPAAAPAEPGAFDFPLGDLEMAEEGADEMEAPAEEPPAMEAEEPVAGEPAAEEPGLEFPMGQVEEEPVAEEPAAEESGLQFEMGGAEEPAAEEAPAPVEEPVADESAPAEEIAHVEEVPAQAPPVEEPAPAEAPAQAAPAGATAPSPDKVPLFSSMSLDEFAEVVAALDHQVYSEGDVIIKEGDEGSSLFVISQGEVSVRTEDPQGNTLELARLGEGDFFGEVSILTGKPRTATIVATKDAELMELTREHLDKISERHPHIKELLQQFYMDRVNNTIEAMVDAALGGDGSDLF